MNNAEIARLDKQIDDAETCTHSIDKHRFKLQKQRNKLIVSAIFESGLLQKLYFQINEHNGKLFLDADDGFDYLPREERNLLGNGVDGGFPHHFTRELSKSVEISVNDGDLSIYFKDNVHVIPFVKKHKLNVLINNVEDKLKTMNEDLAKKRLAIEELEKLRDMFAQKE